MIIAGILIVLTNNVKTQEDTLKTTTKVRSYDVIGTRFNGVILTLNPNTKIIKDTTNTESTELKSFYNGFGVSFKLPIGGNDLKIIQYFKVSKGGTIHGSYQHATRTFTCKQQRLLDFSEWFRQSIPI